MSEHTAKLAQGTVCTVVRAHEPYVSKQGLTCAPAIAAETVGASGIHMQMLTIPPGGRAKTHKHKAHETAIYVLSGEAGMYHGERLEQHLVVRAGEFLYIPANVPHQPYNENQTEPCLAIVARTDPNEQESVVLLPELDTVHT
jgi:uncharacterized RmlC-like cupin family protein